MKTGNWRFRSLVAGTTIAVATLVALGAAGTASDVFAAGTISGTSTGQTKTSAANPAVTGAKKQTLVATYVESGNGSGETLTGETSTALDPINKVTCPSGSTCTITDTISVQLVDHNGDSGNLYAVPWKVDGNPAGEQGPFIGETLTDGVLSGGTWTDQESGVAAGRHSVQSFVFTKDTSNLASWTVTYNVYD